VAPRSRFLIMAKDEGRQTQLGALGGFIREQRARAKLSLRELAERTKVSNAYLSQIERGLHEPSVHVISALAKALDVSAETILRQAGILEKRAAATDVESAIKADERLTSDQQRALIAVYRSYLEQNP